MIANRTISDVTHNVLVHLFVNCCISVSIFFQILITKVTDEQLVAMLAQSEGGDSVLGAKKGGVVVQRRKYGFDEDEDDDSDLL